MDFLLMFSFVLQQYFYLISNLAIKFFSDYYINILIMNSFYWFSGFLGILSLLLSRAVIVKSSTFSSMGRLTPRGSNKDDARFSFISEESQAKRSLGKLSIFQKLSFRWANELIHRDTSTPLQLEDLWRVDDSASEKAGRSFQKYFDLEVLRSSGIGDASTSSSSKKYQSNSTTFNLLPLPFIPKKSTLSQLWGSPVTRALTKLYKRELIISGLLKFAKAGLNLVPSLLVSAILSAVESSVRINADLKYPPNAILEKDFIGQLVASIMSICTHRLDAIGYTFLLLIVLCTKTLIDSQYFDQAINLGASVRNTLAVAIYRKSAQLTPASRQNNTVGKMLNYMQIDTGRVKEVGSHLHNLWEGIMMVSNIEIEYSLILLSLLLSYLFLILVYYYR